MQDKSAEYYRSFSFGRWFEIGPASRLCWQKSPSVRKCFAAHDGRIKLAAMQEKSAVQKFGLALALAAWLGGCATTTPEKAARESWRGVHLWLDRDADAQELI